MKRESKYQQCKNISLTLRRVINTDQPLESLLCIAAVDYSSSLRQVISMSNIIRSLKSILIVAVIDTMALRRIINTANIF